ncbi:MAG: hypothetical protein IKS48_05650 [Eubacterium sp.]|nr:hypothetical protein [Eubacterium sp.]
MNNFFTILFGVVKTPSFLILYVAAIILGIILAIKNGYNEKSSLIAGSLIPIGILVIDAVLLTWAGEYPDVNKYLIVKMVIFIIQLISIGAMFNIYSKYHPSNWVITVFIIVSVVFLAYSYYVYQITYKLGSLFGNKSILLKSLGKFFNNTRSLKFTGLACTYIPLIAVVIDSYLTDKVVNKELKRM